MKLNRQTIFKVLSRALFGVVIKIEVKDNNIEQALRVLKRKLQRDGFFKIIKLKILMRNHLKRKKEYFKKILKE